MSDEPTLVPKTPVSECHKAIIEIRHHVVLALGRLAEMRRDGVVTDEQRGRLEGPLYDAVRVANTIDARRQREASDAAVRTIHREEICE